MCVDEKTNITNKNMKNSVKKFELKMPEAGFSECKRTGYFESYAC